MRSIHVQEANARCGAQDAAVRAVCSSQDKAPLKQESWMPANFSRRKILEYVVGAGIATFSAGISRLSASPSRRPNILFLLADDLRFDAVGYVSRSVHTPNIDRLAQEGVRFANMFVTTSNCWTSRASIFTGTYARRHAIFDPTTPVPANLLRTSYPVLLRHAGYRTGFFGKYGVGDIHQSDDGKWIRDQVPAPDREGFDEIDDFNDYYAPADVNREHHNNQRIADRAERFIRATPVNQPFCLSLSFKAPHANDTDDLIMGEYVAEPDMFELYARDIFTQGPTLNDAAFKSLPAFVQTSESRHRWQGRFSTPWLWQDSVRKYYALATGMDRAIGRVMQALRDRGLEDNTVVIFSSDNGYFLGDYGLSDKWYGYEASVRVPLMIRPLGKPAVAEVSATALNIDLAPTLLALAGVSIPAAMQGRDLSPLWSGGSLSKPWRTDFLYEFSLSGPGKPSPAMEQLERQLGESREQFIPSSEGIRNERYTYLRYPRQKGENEQLFDRVGDANELRNIIHNAPAELVAQLRKRTDELIAMNS
jgi:arylsulfatase A-like enzyme